MINGRVVIDAVVHPYNLSSANLKPHRYSQAGPALLWAVHSTWNPEGLQVDEEAFKTDWPPELLAETLFLESDVDIAVNHRLPLYSYFNDGLVSHEKNRELAARWPDRFICYVGVDGLQGPDAAIADLEAQLRDIPEAVGVKLYPDQADPLRGWRLDDRELAFPLLRRVEELGLRNVAIHKALVNGPVPVEPYRVDDLFGAADAFPNLNFEIVHGGIAFTDETAQLIALFPNVYVNLEVTALFLHRAPGLFADILGKFLMWGGPQKILFSTTGMLAHPQPLIEKMAALELSAEVRDRYGLAALTDEDKAMILGENMARITGIDLPTRLSRIGADSFAEARRNHGLLPPFSRWRAWASEGRLQK